MPETPPNAKLSIPNYQLLTPISGVWRFVARSTVNFLAFVHETAMLNSNGRHKEAGYCAGNEHFNELVAKAKLDEQAVC